MPYLDEAARQLGISEKTLRRWLRLVEPPITPTPHKYDRRYWLISDSDVEVIRRARSELPGNTRSPTTGVISIDSKLDGRRSESDKLPRRDTSLARPTAVTPLPDGLVSRSDAALRHGIALTTLRRWCESGQVETDGGVYAGELGRFSIAHPLTRHGLREFYQMASGRPGFIRCPDCPHIPITAASAAMHAATVAREAQSEASDADAAEMPIPAPPAR